MHYYEHNIGDYRRDTGHLTLLEHGIYRSLIDTYYLTQQPLCSDIAKIMRAHCVRTADEQKALENVLSDFFILTERGYEHKRCEAVITEYAEKSAKSKKAAEARWEKNRKSDAENMHAQCERIPDAMPTINHKPLTNNHKPILKTNTTPPAVAVAPKFDFYESVINLGADPKTVADWKKVRKSKKGANTETALAGFVRESSAAGLSIADAVLICAERGWVSINADWLKPKSQAAPFNQNSSLGKHGQATAENARRWLESQNQNEEVKP